MGIEHGAWCVGCCWALMAALFALGAMSIGWMALTARLIAVEKLSPRKALANRGVAVALLVLGVAVALAPADVPGLTQPSAPEAGQAMGMDRWPRRCLRAPSRAVAAAETCPPSPRSTSPGHPRQPRD